MLFSLWACDATKPFMHQAQIDMQDKNYNEAANNYYNILLLKPGNTEAKQGLKSSAQFVLDGKFEKFSQLVIENKVPDAVKQYQYNQKYYNRVKSVGAEINWPSMYNEVYEDIKDEYIAKIHYNSLELINQKKYEKAEEQFTQLAELDSTYKEVTVVRMSTVLEPLYQRGLRMMKNQNYKEAYFSFEKVLEYDAKYKDSKILKADALDKATITIGLLPMGNQTKLDKEESQLYSQLLTKIQQITNPFIKVLDKSDIENRLKEKQLELASFLNPATAIKTAEVIGLKYLLFSSLDNVQVDNFNPSNETKVAYEAINENVQKGSNGAYQFVTRFKKVNYMETYQMRRVAYKVNYRLANILTLETETADSVEIEQKDEQTIGKYDGDFQNLYPFLPAGNFMPETPNAWRNQFTETKRNLLSISILSTNCSQAVIERIVSDISFYINK
ncbi:MAG: hypothetical protein EBZ58_05870 [Bacteroidetes bacterium]|nr:hypothetical protein [Bacteroidota bacterium]